MPLRPNFRFIHCLAALVTLGVCACSLAPAVMATDDTSDSPVDLKTVKLKELLEQIGSHKSKIVVVDVWATFCVPCKDGFPHLVELQKKHAADGVVCVSVSVDDTDARPAALKFLRKQNAAFPNYLLDEVPTVWQDHWDITAIPAVFVYRDGKLLARFTYDDPDKQFTHKDVENKVASLLKNR
jgi:thiol-disulfide isomerase/thioredoxin